MSAVLAIGDNPGVADDQQLRTAIQQELARSTFANLIRQLQGKTTTGVLSLTVASEAQVQYGTLGAVNADGGGWCNFTLPHGFPAALDAVLAQNTWQGTSNAPFTVVQAVSVNSFRAFVGTAGLNCSCGYIAIGH